MRIIADEVRQHGSCSIHIDAIAARAGVSRSTVQRALREAQQLGLIVVQERRRAGQKSLTNIVRVISQEWRSWLRLADKGGWRSGLSTVDKPGRGKRRDGDPFYTAKGAP